MNLLASLIAGLINSGQIDIDQAATITSQAELIEHANAHLDLRWDAAGEAVPAKVSPDGTIESVCCVEYRQGQDSGTAQKLMLLRGLANLSRSKNLTVGGSESISQGSFNTSIREHSIGLLSKGEVKDSLRLPTRSGSVFCGLISGVVRD